MSEHLGHSEPDGWRPFAVYIAAPWQLQSRGVAMKARLEGLGYRVTSRWLTAEEVNSHESARQDLDDIEAADCLLALNPAEWSEKGTGGRHVEFGYALALRKPILVVGVRSNVFHYLSEVAISRDDDWMIDALFAIIQTPTQ